MPDDIFDDIIKGLEGFCIGFNKFAIILFGCLKYLFVFILLAIGILTLLRLRGKYYFKKQKNPKELNKPSFVLGVFYIMIAFGILFNWFTYFLIWVLDPIPDRLLFKFIDFQGNIDPEYLNRIMDIDSAVYPHEKTIYYALATVSFGAFINIIISIWYLVNRVPFDPKKALISLFAGVMMGILAGFTTCLPLFL